MSKSRRVQSATEDFTACAKARKVPLPLERHYGGKRAGAYDYTFAGGIIH